MGGVKTKEKAQVAPVQTGSWREVYWISPQITVNHGLSPLGDNHWLSDVPHPTREAAEQSAAKSIATCIAQGSPFDAGVEFIEARFFPEDGQ